MSYPLLKSICGALADGANVDLLEPKDRELARVVIEHIRKYDCTPTFGPAVYSAAVMRDCTYPYVDIIVHGDSSGLERLSLSLEEGAELPNIHVRLLPPKKNETEMLADGQVFRGLRRGMKFKGCYELMREDSVVELSIPEVEV